ncbi:MAG TPA: hypothetical protein VII30_08820 [Gemmatimonadaceae bacterium]
MSGTRTIERKAITRPIRNRSEFNQIRAEWMTLMDAPKGTAERDRFELLTILIGAYESGHELSKTQIKTLRDELGIPADLLIG